jgi:hypothetical protein
VFYNTGRAAHMTRGGPRPHALAAKISDAWIHFARKGDPNHAGLPAWPKFNAEQRATMIVNLTCEVKNDPDRELRELVRNGWRPLPGPGRQDRFSRGAGADAVPMTCAGSYRSGQGEVEMRVFRSNAGALELPGNPCEGSFRDGDDL